MPTYTWYSAGPKDKRLSCITSSSQYFVSMKYSPLPDQISDLWPNYTIPVWQPIFSIATLCPLITYLYVVACELNSIIWYFIAMFLTVRTKIGPFAQPDVLQNAPGLPKTRSGKIMRRVLRKIARNDRDIGDISTMADETVVDLLFSLRPQDV